MVQFAKHLKNLLKPPAQRTYEDIRYRFISYYEGVKAKAYKDITGNVTIGIGFNMDRAQAPIEWSKVFNTSVHFYDAYNKKIQLSARQVSQLFDYTVKLRAQELQLIYKSIWAKLAPNERLAVEDLYFNGPILVRGGKNPSKFWLYMHRYIESNSLAFLENAVEEVLYHSNPSKHSGINKRRQAQALMLCPEALEHKVCDNQDLSLRF